MKSRSRGNTGDGGWALPTWTVVIGGSFLCVVVVQLNRSYLAGESSARPFLGSLVFLCTSGIVASVLMMTLRKRVARRSSAMMAMLSAVVGVLYVVSVVIYG